MHFLTNLVAWILFGAIAGWLTAKFMHLSTGFWQNTFLGIVGAILGGAIMSLIGGAGITGFNIYSLLVSIAGACLFTWLVRKLDSRKGTK
jgi:uncharacterized membrane protein YeaQ/YmgE (transglycosylase-associated protein family)